MSLSELIIDIPAEYEMNVFGQFDTYIKKIERTFHVTLISRDGATKIVGDTIAAQKAQRVLTQLVELAKRGVLFQNIPVLIPFHYYLESILMLLQLGLVMIFLQNF